MQVLFLQDVKNIARRGDVKTVKEGYFMNFLMPKKIAVVATAGKIKEAEKMKQNEVIQKERLVEEAKEVCKKLEGLFISIKAKAKGDKLYGSIGEKELIKEIEKAAKVKLEKQHFDMPEHIKTVGEHEITIQLAEGASAKIKLEVQSEE